MACSRVVHRGCCRCCQGRTRRHRLPPASRGNFWDICPAVLDRLEDHCWWFWASQMKGDDRPFTWAWKLHDVMRWLQPEPSEGEAHVLAKVKQFVERLPGSTAIGQRAWRLRSPWLSTWQPWQKEQSGAFFPTPTSTPECQLVSQPAIAKTPLHSLRLRAIPFKRLGMDLIGPSPECKWLSLCISSGVLLTRYPEALPLHTISAKSVLQALFQFISWPAS